MNLLVRPRVKQRRRRRERQISNFNYNKIGLDYENNNFAPAPYVQSCCHAFLNISLPSLYEDNVKL